MNYPKWIYHATQPARIVQNFEEHEAAGDGWAESPDEALSAKPAKLKKAKE